MKNTKSNASNMKSSFKVKFEAWKSSTTNFSENIKTDV